MTAIAAILIYWAMGMLTAVMMAFILQVVGEEPKPREVAIAFVFWPITLCILFAGALEESK